MLAKLQVVYTLAKARQLVRWSGDTRHWTTVATVWLDPNREVFTPTRIINAKAQETDYLTLTGRRLRPRSHSFSASLALWRTASLSSSTA
jgi:hypothetical protein